MPMWDAIIVGAGPAGISAAMAVLRAGGKPLLIDRKTFPREKACAGMLSAAAVAAAPFHPGPVICAVSSGILWREHGKDTHLHEQNLLTHRIELDDFMFRQAMGAGVAFRQVPELIKLRQTAHEVRLTTGQRELLVARHVIAADGANSLIRRLLNLPSVGHDAFAIEVDLALPADAKTRPALFDYDFVTGGYGWHFPKGNTSNLGIAFMHGLHGNIATALDSFIQCHGKEALQQGRSRGAAIGSYGPDTCLGIERTLLCGDAAGLADPWTGEGISMAFKSGHAAGTAVMRYQQEQQLQQLQQQSRHVKSALLHYQEMLSPLLDQLKKRQQQATPMSYGSTT